MVRACFAGMHSGHASAADFGIVDIVMRSGRSGTPPARVRQERGRCIEAAGNCTRGSGLLS